MPSPDNLPRVSPGDPLTEEVLSAYLDALRASALAMGSGLQGGQRSPGTTLTARTEQAYWIKLTSGGTGGAYAWVQQIPTDGGTWIDGPRAGTTTDDPALEVNATATIDTTGSPIVWAWRDTRGKLRFQMGVCA